MDGIRGEGGGHEDGTSFATTGASSPGTRANGGEDDDGCAGGPSWDQILLKNVPALSRRNEQGTIIGKGYYNAICDKRVDSYETSTRCLSYGYDKQTINSARPGGTIRENKPLLPEMSPLTAYKDLFGGFVPGATISDRDALRLLKLRKSVLDYSLRELDRLKTLGPASEREKIDGHAAAVRKLEAQLSDQIAGGGATRACAPPPMPDAALTGKDGDVPARRLQHARRPTPPTRRRTRRWARRTPRSSGPRSRATSFAWPRSSGRPAPTTSPSRASIRSDPDTIWMHHPLSHQVTDAAFFNGPRPAESAYVWDAMVNVNRWYFQKTADIINDFRSQVDPQDPAGGSLLDHTVIPMITEVAEASHTREGHAALVFGGGKLGMQGGQYRSVAGIHNQLWVTVAQAFLGADVVAKLAGEAYVKSGASPIAGLWAAPQAPG